LLQDALYSGKIEELGVHLQQVWEIHQDLQFSVCFTCALFSHIVLHKTESPHLPALSELLHNYLHSRPSEISLYLWILGGCEGFRTDKSGLLMLQPIILLASISLFLNKSFWASMLFDCGPQSESFIPTIDKDAMGNVGSAMGYVGWYKCRNGHLYTVGNCTYPMEIARCPTCGSKIGGENHEAVEGVTRLGNHGVPVDPIPGYCRTLASGSCGNTFDFKVQVEIIFRFFIHALLFLNYEISDGRGKEEVTQLVNQETPLTKEAAPIKDFRVYFKRILEISWSGLQNGPALLSEDVLSLSLCYFIKDIWNSYALCKDSVFQTEDERHFFIHNYEPLVQKWQGVHNRNSTLSKDLRKCQEKLSDTGRISAIQNFIGEDRFQKLLGKNAALNPESQIWCLYDKVSFRHFKQDFFSEDDTTRQFPLLAAVLENERHLGLIKHIAHILNWHQIIMRAFNAKRPTREEAQNMSNKDVIELLPQNQQAQSVKILEDYCVGFNAAFPFVLNLYECQRNPFLTEDGKVDLSGTGSAGEAGLMSASTPVSFSIPSVAPGETDAAGMCTVQLLNFLQRVHNGLFDGLAQYTRPAEEEDHDGVEEVKGEEGQRVATTGADALERIPPTTCSTPTQVLERRLIMYSRDDDLMPLIYIHVLQDLRMKAADQGEIMGYNFGGIESALTRKVFRTATRIILQVSNFQYAGEFRSAGHLRGLQARIPQEALPSTTCETILSELDTQERLVALRNQLEECMHFLVSVGGRTVQGISGDTNLEDYILKTLLVERSTWESIATPTIVDNIKLCHLQALLLCLEEHMHGSPLDNICQKYREEVPPELAEILRLAAVGMDLPILLPALHDFMLDQLCTEAWDASASLKEYLSYSSDTVTENNWYETVFPEEMQLAHSFGAYKLLTEIQ